MYDGGWNDFLASIVISPVLQPAAFVTTWVEGSTFARISIGIGIIIFGTSLYLTLKKNEKKHILWGIIGLTIPVTMETTLTVFGILYM